VIGTGITLKEVLDHLDSGQEFSMMVITCNEKKQTGGEELWIDKAEKHLPLNHRQRAALKKQQPSSLLKKNPNHYDNSTRNLRMPNGDLVKIHIRLIRIFNGKTVL
jgi:hypothetical protein